MNKTVSLESIRAERAALQKKAKIVRQRITAYSSSLMTQETPLTQRERIMNYISKGIAIADGAIMGVRVMRRIRKYFKKK